MILYEGVRYAKQMDGCYHLFVAGAQIIPENSVMIKTINEVEKILSNVKFKRMMLVITNDVKKT